MLTNFFETLFVILMSGLALMSGYLMLTTPHTLKRVSHGLFMVAFSLFIANAFLKIVGFMVLGAFFAVAGAIIRKRIEANEPVAK